ncbi:MAG: Holliday junction branch migration protein RuvA [Acholeplasmatales bacterium]|jgi:Holliday junction DNA helicase RuvA|nr:Holliday junction branch migration protein RuvA [Acholeplasmatales bacterium]
MYSYIIGTIKNINPQNIVLECQNIGYAIITPNNFNYHLNDEVKIYTHQHVKEDAITLYGFSSAEDRDFFIKLLSVTGIGPKSALSLLSKEDLNYLKQAIESGNAKYLTTFPGIGLKSANQIILDLKGRLTIHEVADNFHDAVLALCSLGYHKDKINTILKNLNLSPNLSTSLIVKEILKEINN